MPELVITQHFHRGYRVREDKRNGTSVVLEPGSRQVLHRAKSVQDAHTWIERQQRRSPDGKREAEE